MKMFRQCVTHYGTKL